MCWEHYGTQDLRYIRTRLGNLWLTALKIRSCQCQNPPKTQPPNIATMDYNPQHDTTMAHSHSPEFLHRTTVPNHPHTLYKYGPSQQLWMHATYRVLHSWHQVLFANRLDLNILDLTHESTLRPGNCLPVVFNKTSNLHLHPSPTFGSSVLILTRQKKKIPCHRVKAKCQLISVPKTPFLKASLKVFATAA